MSSTLIYQDDNLHLTRRKSDSEASSEHEQAEAVNGEGVREFSTEIHFNKSQDPPEENYSPSSNEHEDDIDVPPRVFDLTNRISANKSGDVEAFLNCGSNNDDNHNGIDDTNTNDEMMKLEEDTYSFMLVSTSYKTPAFWFSVLISFQQIAILVAILTQMLEPRSDTPKFNLPFSNAPIVQFGQFTTIIFVILTQRDFLKSIPLFIAFFKEENWSKLKLKGIQREKWFWWEKILGTYALRLSLSTLTMFTAFILIIQSTDIIDLVKDFTAIFIVAQLDEFAYLAVKDGYFGEIFHEEVARIKEIKIKRADIKVTMCNKAVPTQSIVAVSLFSIMFVSWAVAVRSQNNGSAFHEIYESCASSVFKENSLSYRNWGDGSCDPRLFTKACGLDGGVS